MPNKKENEDTAKNASRTKTIPMLKLDNEKKIPTKIVYMKDNSKCFGINDIDINKIRISEKSIYCKQYNSYKDYVLYEHNKECMLLRITLKDLVGYYDVYNDDKRINFKINDEVSDKIYQKHINIFEHIEEKLNIALNGFTFEKNGESYFKIKATDEICFKEKAEPTSTLKEGKVVSKERDANFILKENVMDTCRALLQILSVFFKSKDKNNDISYYLQLLLQQCICKRFINNVIFHPDLEFTDTGPEPESESEEETNESTVLDE